MTITAAEGTYHPLLSNTLDIAAQCDVTGSGGGTTGCWQGQLALCGTSACNTAALPPFGGASSTTLTPGMYAVPDRRFYLSSSYLPVRVPH